MKQSGFTLIELSIVLVIIGLLAGGILVGRDMIKAAEIRQTVAQVEKFTAAVNTFRTKFNCLPGDCKNAALLGFASDSAGDGNGEIGCNDMNGNTCTGSGGSVGTYTSTVESGEYKNFWHMLGAAGLVNMSVGTFTGSTAQSAGIDSPPPAIKPMSTQFGQSGWAVRNSFTLTPSSGPYQRMGGHFFALSNSVPLSVIETGNYSPADMFALDQKLDDGFPETGSTRAYTQGLGGGLPYPQFSYEITAVASGQPGCIINAGSPRPYNIQYTGSTYLSMCSVLIKAGF